MTSRLFHTFRELLENIPVKAILRATQAERRMVEDDLAKKRIPDDDEAQSILHFCSFLEEAALGQYANLPPLPIEHCAFYRGVIERLVSAGELPANVQAQMDQSFSRALQEALMCPA